MKYFAQVVDHWDEELDILGPFDTMQEAWDAAQAKWNGDDNMADIWIIRTAIPPIQTPNVGNS